MLTCFASGKGIRPPALLLHLGQRLSQRRTYHQLSRQAMKYAIEEQTLPRFQQKQYCPVEPGQVLARRYQVITKLGYGAYSTVWLTRDQK